MKIATWNVNSVKARLPAIAAWLTQAAPDAVALQEIKTVEESFPAAAFEDLGYNCIVYGQKSYNGVAILSKRPVEDVVRGLGPDETEARYLEALIPGARGMLRLGALYAPNGNPADGDKFAGKLAWMDRLRDRAAALLRNEEPLALAGDFNVIPRDEDCFDPEVWKDDALFRPESRAALRRLEHLGFADAVCVRNRAGGQYTFWDYQADSWANNRGIRIDHILLSPQALDLLGPVGIDKAVRAGPRPSDHVPLWCELAL